MPPILEQGESDGKSPPEPREVAPLFPLLFTVKLSATDCSSPQETSIVDGQRMGKQQMVDDKPTVDIKIFANLA
jgi:hypothetical protein